MIVHRNKLTKEYAQYCEKLVDLGHASSVLENHDYFDFNVFTKRGDTVIKVDQYKSAGIGGGALSSFTGLPSTIFHELYGEESYINELYDVIEGTYPKNKDEIVLIVDESNRLPVSTLYELGLTNSKTVTEGQEIPFENIVGKEYKIYSPSTIYDMNTRVEHDVSGYTINFETMRSEAVNKKIATYHDITQDPTELKNFYESDEELLNLKVVGIIRPSENSKIALMPGSIGYLSSLKEYCLSEYTKEDIQVRKDSQNNWIMTNGNAFSFFGALMSGDTKKITEVLENNFKFYSVLATAGGNLNDTLGYEGYKEQCLSFGNEFVTPIIGEGAMGMAIENASELTNGPIDILLLWKVILLYQVS
jgi:hypothetical protein